MDRKMVNFVSRFEMKEYIKSNSHIHDDLAIISISDSRNEYDEMVELLDGSNCICLKFADTEDEWMGITDAHAKSILSFIDKNHDKDFIVHCFAGVSRSGAVAVFINEYLDRGHMYLEDYKGYNRRVYNKLMAAAGMSLAAYYEELEKKDRML